MSERRGRVEIRPMAVEDFAAVYRLGCRCYDVLDKPYNYWSIREVADHLESNPHLCFVAVADGDVVGFALGAEAFELLENTAHLEWVAVAPELRRAGVAARLIAATVEAVEKLGKVRVVADVSTANAASRGLFAKLGFSEGISVTFFGKEL
jgi:ribosomal protein S18 acetylase RimI-like enzyme